MALNIEVIEKKYNVRYVGFYDIPGRDNVYVFYQDNPRLDLGHSNYLGVFIRHRFEEDEVWLCNAKTIEEASYNAISINGKMLCSRYHHDFQTEGGAMIDGGLDYCRFNPEFPVTHKMRVLEGMEVFESVV